MKLSIVATLYQSSQYIDEFYSRSEKVARELSDKSFEIIFVNDGSPDDSLEKAVSISNSDDHVVVIDLSRNFGHHKAMMTGLSYARGENIFLIDADLEERPEWLVGFDKFMIENECDVVYGVQKLRKGGIFEQISGDWFYRLLNILTGLNLPKNVVTARLMSKRYVEALVSHQESEIFIAGLWHITGFDQREFIVKKESLSETTYTLRKKLSILVNSVTSFSNAPLKSIFYIGVLISTLAFLYICYIMYQSVFIARPLSGWPSLMASIWMLGGMIISFLGVIGIYLSKIFSETKNRPYTVVRHIYGKK